ncbi:MAG: serine/threonine protein kinase [Kiritimatiellaeota bacterium]|nr:serine/threonine protein kinase [Kiritimatiellota bacterium]
MLGRKVRCPECDKTTRLNSNPFDAGRIIGDFIIQRKLGAGSIGAVYFAHQISLDRPIALKVLSKEYSDNKGIEAFLKEARAAASLSHPNLVQALGVGEENGICFMAMTFIEGESVKDIIKREGQIKVDKALHIAQQVAEALYFAWSESELIHRDVKPENIMITSEGMVKLTDLGLAMKETEWHEDMEISGSPSYMSPEQFTGEKIDTRSDIYSLGISLYQTLSGKLPFTGATLKTVARQHFHEASKPLHKVDPMIPSKVSALVQKMIEKEPKDRYQNMEELIKAIWKVRQATAPDKDLVPSVHTISIKKLDYQLQELTEDRKKHIAVELKDDKLKRVMLFRAAVVILPIVLVGVIWAIVSHFETARMRNDLTLQIDKLEALVEKKQISTNMKLLSWDDIDRQLSKSDSSFDKYAHARMRYIKERMKTTQLAEENERLLKVAKFIKKNSSLKLKKLINDNMRAAEVLAKKTAELEEKERLFNEKINAAMRSKNSLQDKLKRSIAEHLDMRKNTIRRKLCILASKLKLKEAKALLKVEKEKTTTKGMLEWLDAKITVVEWLDTLRVALTSSGEEFKGKRIESGAIKNIEDGVVEYTIMINDSLETGKIKWTNLSEESLYSIAKQALPNLSEDTLRALVLIIKGKITKIPSVTKNKEHLAIVWAVCDYKLDLIKRLLNVDSEKAQEEAARFRKIIAESPETNERYSRKIDEIFE